MASVAQGSVVAPVAPPTPQEITRKLSVHNKPKAKSAPPPVSGTESDSDSLFSPDISPRLSATTYTNTGNVSHSLVASSSASKHLSAIAEGRTGSGGEETDEDDEDDECHPDVNQSFNANMRLKRQSQDGDSIIKSGYLWKKGERRKTWKKRWFVLRPTQLAFYKSSAEYQLLRLLDLSEIHSCTSVELKRHAHAFALVSPKRTFYLHASSDGEVDEWITQLNEACENLKTTSTQTSISTPIPIPIPPGRRSESYQHARGASPAAPANASPPSVHPVTSDSDSDDQLGPVSAGLSPNAPTMMMASPSKGQIDPSKTIVQGYLMKCSRSKRRGWRKRWFVLTGEKLTYSASHMDVKHHKSIMLPQIIDALEYDLEKPPITGGSGLTASSQPGLGTGVAISPRSGSNSGADEHRQHSQEGSGGAGVGSIEIGTGGSSSSHNGQHTFKVITTKRSLLLSAPSEGEEIKWLSAVRAVIARRGTGPSNAPNPTSGTSIAGSPPNMNGWNDASGRMSVSAVNRKRSTSGASGMTSQYS